MLAVWLEDGVDDGTKKRLYSSRTAFSKFEYLQAYYFLGGKCLFNVDDSERISAEVRSRNISVRVSDEDENVQSVSHTRNFEIILFVDSSSWISLTSIRLRRRI